MSRKRKFSLRIARNALAICILVFIAFIHNLNYAEGKEEDDDEDSLISRKLRNRGRLIKHGDVNIIVLDDAERKKYSPSLGLLSTTARTFIQDGTTTEYATQVYGTNVNNKYAHIVNTGSKIFFDNDHSSKNHNYYPDPIVDLPNFDIVELSKDDSHISPSRVFNNNEETIINSEEQETTKKKDGKKLDISGSKNGIGSAFQKDDKGNLPFPLPHNNSSSVVITSSSNEKSTYKTSVSVKKNPPINAAKVKAKDGLPTFTVKQEGFSYDDVSSEVSEENNILSDTSKSLKALNTGKTMAPKVEEIKYTTTTYYGFANYVTTAGNTVIIFTPDTPRPNTAAVTSISGQPTLSSKDILPSEMVNSDSFSKQPIEEIMETEEDSDIISSSIPDNRVKSTIQATSPLSRYIFETTKVFKTVPDPLGLVKTISAIQENSDTTTHFTTFFYGTRRDNKYYQLKQTVSKVIEPTDASSIKHATTSVDPTTTPYDETTLKVITTTSDDLLSSDLQITTVNPLVDTDTESDPNLTTTDSSLEANIETESKSTESDDDDSTSNQSSSTQPTTSASSPNSQNVSDDDTVKNVSEQSTIETSTDTKEDVATTTEPEEPITMTEKEDVTTTEPPSETCCDFETDEEHNTESSTSESKPEVNLDTEEEVELIFKTLYTTYTYLTTYFEKSTSRVSSREEVVTNIVTSTLDNNFIQQATDPAFAGLFDDKKFGPSATRSGRHFSTIESSSTPRSRPSVIKEKQLPKVQEISSSISDALDVENEVQATPTLSELVQDPSTVKTFYKTYTQFTTSLVNEQHSITNNTEIYTNYVTPTVLKKGIRKVLKSAVNSTSALNDTDHSLTARRVPIYKSVIKRVKPTKVDLYRTNSIAATADAAVNGTQTEPSFEAVSPKEFVTSATDMVIRGVKRTSEGSKKIYLGGEMTDDQVSSESNTEEIDPSPSLISLQTSYTTFTYFTTIYKGSTSDVVSSLDTVTNVVTELVKPTETLSDYLTDETTLPVTYFTTYTYWTTYYKGTSTIIQSKEETISSVMTPTPTLSANDSPKTEIINSTASSNVAEPVTYFTTFTYFTTSYSGNTSVVNSRLETVTNVVDNDTTIDEPDLLSSTHSPDQVPVFKATGLLSSHESTKVDSNATTIFTTNTYGTYIDGLYAQVLESTSSIMNSTPSISENMGNKATGVISINEGKIVDAFGISTTFYTTKVLGTYVDQLYAQIIESTSSVKVNDDKKTIDLLDSSTVLVDGKIYHTGLVQLIEGSITKDDVTTFYESLIKGSLMGNKYTLVTESSISTSQLKITPTSTIPTDISPTSVLSTSSSTPLASSITFTSPTPSVIESSMHKEEDGEEDDDEEEDSEKTDVSSVQSRRNTFTPVIRPFASRSRPNFLPKKKTAEPLGAATVNRDITPTVVATPALKSNERGSFSRNRFANNKRQSTSSFNSPIYESSISSYSSRKFSKPKGSSSYSSISSSFRPSSARDRGSTSTRSFATSQLSGRRASYKPSSAQQESATPTGSRFRIRPTSSFSQGRQSKVQVINNNYSDEEAEDNSEVSTSIVTEQAEVPSQDEVAFTVPTQTNTGVSRNNNPLLRLKKPLTTRTKPTSTSAPRTTTTQQRTTSRKNSNRVTTTKGTTPTPKPRTPSTLNSRFRPRPGLFPPKDLLRKTGEPPVETEKPVLNIEDQALEEDENLQDDNSLELTPRATTKSSDIDNSRRGRNYNQVQIKPSGFGRRERTKRQAEFGYRYEGGRSNNNWNTNNNNNYYYNSRFNRPQSQTENVYYDEIEVFTEPPVRSTPSRSKYGKARGQQQIQQQQITTQSPRIYPSSVSTNPSRLQFTLREKSSTATSTASPRSTKRRPTSSPQRRKPTQSTENTYSSKRPQSRFRGYSTTELTPFKNSRKTASTRRTTSRGRYQDDVSGNSYSQPISDGTITVTYKIPTEVTIPIVNGKVTEYRTVITAKPSLQVLGPLQYSTTAGKNGLGTTQLVSEITEALPNGMTEVTRFILQETPTTSVAFTPTSIRGRKTSFSHIVPSTIYEVKTEVSTVQPQFGTNAPLANLLLSQLLLGNLGLQQTLNPLIAFNNQIPQIPQTPITEFKTKTTSYVTTITDATSTVIPITFRGKEIKTTVIDSSTQVITATEYVTETVVITPTQTIPMANNQFNTLLLPALLQAQQLLNPPIGMAQNLVQTNSLPDENQQVDTDNPSRSSASEKPYQEEGVIDKQAGDYTEYSLKRGGKMAKKKIGIKNGENVPPDPVISAAQTSVLTLYVSGRKPGDFSTILSTVTLEEKSATLHKREINSNLPIYHNIEPSMKPYLYHEAPYEDDEYIDDIVKPGIFEIPVENNEIETESLQSIIGDITKHVTLGESYKTNTKEMNFPKSEKPLLIASNKTTTGHFFLKSSTEAAPFQWNIPSYDNRSPKSLNFSQRHKRNAVIGTTNLSNLQFNNEILNKINRQISVTTWKPKLKFSKNSVDTKNDNSSTESFNGRLFGKIEIGRNSNTSTVHSDQQVYAADEDFRAKYTLATKVMSNGVEVIVAVNKSSIPGNHQVLRVLPSSSMRPITLAPTTVTDYMMMVLPHGLQTDTSNIFDTKTYLTTYTYFTTFLHEGNTLVSSKEKVVSNVVTETGGNTITNTNDKEEHITLSSSPTLATSVFHTEITLEDTFTENSTPVVVTSTKTIANTVTAPTEYMPFIQPSEPVIQSSANSFKTEINEDYVATPTQKLNTKINYEPNSEEDSIKVEPTTEQTAYITKTYFVTYTYFSTILDNGSTVVKSNVATSSDVVTEKFFMPPKRTKVPNGLDQQTSTKSEEEFAKPINIYATKTYLTTYTYFTTLLQNRGSKPSQTFVKSRTKVVQNVVTESLNTNLLSSDYLSTLRSSLERDPVPIVATATLNNGQQLEITAMNEQSPHYEQISSSFEGNSNDSEDFKENSVIYTDNDDTSDSQQDSSSSSSEEIKEEVEKGEVEKPAANSYSTTVLRSSTVTKNGATLLPGSQVIEFVDVNGTTNFIPLSDPLTKVQTKKPPLSNNFLNLGSFGMNGLNALKPVLNAVAGLWQVNSKPDKGSSQNKVSQKPSNKNNVNPSSNLVKTPNRAPIYIPVGTFSQEPEVAESEHIDVSQQFPDIEERNKIPPFIAQPTIGKPSVESPLLSGGIPISPGQIINANTDVIVGIPSVGGPRPPVKPVYEKNEVPIGIKPPPISSQYHSQIKFNPHGPHIDKHPYKESLKIPYKPPKPIFLSQGHFLSNQSLGIKNRYNNYVPNYDQNVPQPTEIRTSHVPPNAINTFPKFNSSNILSNSLLMEQPLSNPLLVNIKPSQVAQVVIPHGSQTALIYSNQVPTHGLKGEIFNDPSPYPEDNVHPGFVGVQVYGPNNNYPAHIPTVPSSSNTIHLNIPVDPYSNDDSITQSHHVIFVEPDKQKIQNPFNVKNWSIQNGTSVLSIPQEEIQNAFNYKKRPNSKYNTTENDRLSMFTVPNRPYVWLQKKPSNTNQQHPTNVESYGGYPSGPNKNSIDQSVYDNNLENNLSQGSIVDNEAGLKGKDEQPEESNISPVLPQNDDAIQYGVRNGTFDNKVSINSSPTISYEWNVMDGGKFDNNSLDHKAPLHLSPVKNRIKNTTEPTYQQKYPNHPVKTQDEIRVDYPKLKYGDRINTTSKEESTLLSSQGVPKPFDLKKENEKSSSKEDVIGMHPPPLPSQQSAKDPSSNPPYNNRGQHKRPTSHKQPPKIRPRPPYPFERPLSTSRPSNPVKTHRPGFHELDPAKLSEEIIKLKPLNLTGKIETVKKWQTSTTLKPEHVFPVFGSIMRVEDPSENTDDQKHEESQKEVSNVGSNAGSQTLVIGKPVTDSDLDKNDELSNKWGEDTSSTSDNKIEDESHKPANESKSLSASNTIFGNLYTRPPPANIVILPTPTTTNHHTAISMIVGEDEMRQQSHLDSLEHVKETPSVLNSVNSVTTEDGGAVYHERENDNGKMENSHDTTVQYPTFYHTHTKTLSVTITATTVVQVNGKPSTHTLILTKTHTSTIEDTVTKIHTLVQPTRILSTITTTVPISVSKDTTYMLSPSSVEPSHIVTSTIPSHSPEDSIFVVMTDKRPGSVHIDPTPPDSRTAAPPEIQVPDETNEISPNGILYSGIFTHSTNENECKPECKASKNEICQKVTGIMRCVCRPGFARMFPDHPCKPTYTYTMRLVLERQGKDEIRYTGSLSDRTSPTHQQLSEATKDGLDRLVMQSDLRDIYHGIVVTGFEPVRKSDKALVVYMVQLSENTDKLRLQEEVNKSLKANNYSLGGTDIFAAHDMSHLIKAEDFDECSNEKFHDCSENAQCFNLRGTYTCSCKEGFIDLSLNNQYPGRVCSAEMIGCESCNYHGTCYFRNDDEAVCECFQWYAGSSCQINMKVILMSLITLGILLSVLLVVCVVMTCNKKKPPEILRSAPKPNGGFKRYRSINNLSGDRRAIVNLETSSEGSIERTPPPYMKQRPFHKLQAMSMHSESSSNGCGNIPGTMHCNEQRDRSLSVLIPRAKYRPPTIPTNPSLLTMSTFGPEQKLINYNLMHEGQKTPEKRLSRCSTRNASSQSVEHPHRRKKPVAPRRPSSGALVSAGFEVSATVRRTQELNEAYILNQAHSDVNEQSFNTMRTVDSSVLADGPLSIGQSLDVSLEDFMATRVGRLGTVSEARSYDETTIQPPVRSFHNILSSHNCDSKSSSLHKTNADEHHTMGERDLGSTYLVPQSQLYKHDNRESDGSNFDSL